MKNGAPRAALPKVRLAARLGAGQILGYTRTDPGDAGKTRRHRVGNAMKDGLRVMDSDLHVIEMEDVYETCFAGPHRDQMPGRELSA